jgi:hypothetical protein
VKRTCGTHGEERKVYKVLVGSQKERDNSKDSGVDVGMGLELILGILDGGVWSGFSWLRIRVAFGLL